MTTINQNRKLHYLFSCETSLTERRKENQQYEDRLKQEAEKRNQLRAKLERIRGLILENQIDKLKHLLKNGEI